MKLPWQKASTPSVEKIESRQQHYLFAHRMLPQLGFKSPGHMMGILGGPDAQKYLQHIWQIVGDDVPEKARLAFAGLDCWSFRDGDYLVAIVILPPPMAVTEAFYTAFVCGPLDVESIAPEAMESALQDVPLRYFTLEFGFVLEGDAPRTVLGAWTKEGTHFNMGDGPPPELRAFAAALHTMNYPDEVV